MYILILYVIIKRKLRIMSGIQNIKKLAEKYKQAEIYFHIDLDGVTSAIAMKEYLKRNGITVVDVHKINYGADEYSVVKPNDGNMGVMVDFSHSKPYIQIHTDHHLTQITNKDSSKHFKSSKSNASTISSIIGNGIFSIFDEKAINMIDSASFLEENIFPTDIGNAKFKCNKKDVYKQHLMMALVCNKLLLTYKNKMRFLEDLVLNCNPSLISIYNRIIYLLHSNLLVGNRGWITTDMINENVESYFNEQKRKSKKIQDLDDIMSLKNGQSIYYKGCIVQVGGGYMKNIGSYERYTAFKIYPDAKYFIMIWDELAMMQVSINPWYKKENKTNLNDTVMNIILPKMSGNEIFKTKISLMAIKKAMENNINEYNEQFYDGFTYNDFLDIFNYSFYLSDEDKDKIEKCMMLKYTKYCPDEKSSDRRKAQSMNMINYLNNFRIPLIDVLEKLSGGHKEITNFVGLNLLNTQRMIDISLENNINPYYKNNDLLNQYNNQETTNFLKQMAINIIYELLKKIVV